MAKISSTATIVMGLALMLASVSAWANDHQACWVASDESGVLQFSGVTEGRGFEGVFESFDVRLCLAGEDLATATIEVTVETASANTKSRDRDQTLKGEEFFWVSQFPEASWVSQSIKPTEGEFTHTAEGELALRDVRLNQPVEMSLIVSGDGPKLVGQASILRLDYNVGIGEFEDTDFIKNEVKLAFDLTLEPEA